MRVAVCPDSQTGSANGMICCIGAGLAVLGAALMGGGYLMERAEQRHEIEEHDHAMAEMPRYARMRLRKDARAANAKTPGMERVSAQR